jgi:hypothetical protein
MIAAGKPCPLCTAPLVLKKRAEFSGDESPLRVTLVDVPILTCDKPHAYFVHPKFALWLMDQLLDADFDSTPAGTARGLLFKSYACHGCGGALERVAQSKEQRFELAYKDFGAFEARLSMPLYKCAGCGSEQLRAGGEARKLLPAGLVHAFKEAGIRPAV